MTKVPAVVSTTACLLAISAAGMVALNGALGAGRRAACEAAGAAPAAAIAAARTSRTESIADGRLFQRAIDRRLRQRAHDRVALGVRVEVVLAQLRLQQARLVGHRREVIEVHVVVRGRV